MWTDYTTVQPHLTVKRMAHMMPGVPSYISCLLLSDCFMASLFTNSCLFSHPHLKPMIGHGLSTLVRKLKSYEENLHTPAIPRDSQAHCVSVCCLPACDLMVLLSDFVLAPSCFICVTILLYSLSSPTLELRAEVSI